MPEIRHIDSGKLLCLEETGSYQDMGELFGRLTDFLKERRVAWRGDRLAVFYDNPEEVNRERVHFAAGVELSGETTGDGEITVVIQGSATMACELHRGPYETIPDTYRKVVAWIHEHGYKINGAAREYFLTGPPLEPAAYMTEIQIPVESASSGETHATQTD